MPARKAPSAERTASSPLIKRLKQGFALLTILVLAGVIAGGIYFGLMLREAEQMLDNLPQRIQQFAGKPSEIVSADGQVLYSVSAENRIPVKLGEVPKHVRNAVLAAEDKRFYQHEGFDVITLGKAALEAVREQKVSRGGSTLTMQLAKRLYTSTERRLTRKVMDIAIASVMEKRMSKDEILQLYLNQVYYGERAYGIAAAAKVYFGKDVGDLTLAEGAMLARTVRRPSRDNPYEDYEGAMRNKAVVLGVMLEEKMISRAEYEEALAARPKLAGRAGSQSAPRMRAPYFVMHVLDTLKDEMPEIDLNSGGYRVETTLDTRVQAVSEKAVRDVVREYRRRGVTTGAFVMMDTEGRILAEVGGVDFADSQFNVVTQGSRQPGSAFKPFVYAAALATGALDPRERVSNREFRWTDPATGEDWVPKNSGKARWGSEVPLETALAFSINRPAVNTIAAVGPPTVAAYARDSFGFPASRFQGVGPTSYALALGAWPVSPLEMASAYSVFQLKGDRVQPRAIVRVIAPDGTTLRYWDPVRLRRVLPESVAETIDGCLRAVVTKGTARIAGAVEDARGKTGTTNDGKDAWFAGYTDRFVGVGWVANYQRVNGKPAYLPMPRVFGGTVTVRIWTKAVGEAEKIIKGEAPSEELQPLEEGVAEPRTQARTPEGREPRDPAPFVAEPSPTAESTGEEPVVEDPAVNEGSPEPRDPAGAGGTEDPGTTASPAPTPRSASPTTVPRTPPRPRETPRAPRRPAEETVEIEVCADSGRPASQYCPETILRRFPRNQVPRGTCPIHTGQQR